MKNTDIEKTGGMESSEVQAGGITKDEAAERLMAELDKGMKSAEEGWLTLEEVEERLELWGFDGAADEK